MNLTPSNSASVPKAPSAKILMVDDEVNILAGFKRTLGRKWDIVTADGGEAALEILRTQGPFAVVVTDMQMPKMNGVELLERVKSTYKEVVCMMLTGNADQDTATQAINRGHIFRFMNKPCPAEVMEVALATAVRQYELESAERVLLRDTLSGAVRVLIEAMGCSHPQLTEVTAAVRRHVQSMGEAVGVGTDWRLGLASALCMIGFTVVHSEDDDAMLDDARLAESASSGARLIGFIPRLQPVSEIVRRQRERLPLPLAIRPGNNSDLEIVCSQLLRWAVDIERVHAGKLNAGLLIRELKSDPSPLAELLCPVIERCAAPRKTSASHVPEHWKSFKVPLRMLREGMVMDQDVQAMGGRVLLTKGFVLTAVTIERLRSFAQVGLVGTEIAIRAPDDPMANAA